MYAVAIEADDIEQIGRVPDEYGFVYESDDMALIINKGDTVWVHRTDRPKVGNKIVLEHVDVSNNRVVAFLHGETEIGWRLARFDGEWKLIEFTLAKAEWPTIKKVAGIEFR